MYPVSPSKELCEVVALKKIYFSEDLINITLIGSQSKPVHLGMSLHQIYITPKPKDNT